MLTRGTVERRAQAGAEVNALIAALAATAEAIPASSYALRHRSRPHRRDSVRAQCAGWPDAAAGAAPIAVAAISSCSSPTSSRMAADAGEQHHRPPQVRAARGRDRESAGAGDHAPLAVPDRFFCWSTKTHALVSMPLAFAPGYSDWNDVWARGLDAAGCRRMIALNDLARHHAPLRAELEAAMARVHDRGRYILGPEVEAFEREFAAYCGVAECVAVGNGTDALELALRALDDRSGRRQSRPSPTPGMYATTAIRAVGSTARLRRDRRVDAADGSRRARASMPPRTRAVVVTHLYGRARRRRCDSDRSRRERGIALIEDCAQAHGARAVAGMAGTFGALGCFSFYPTKNLGALGDAGARRHRRSRRSRRNCARCAPTAGGAKYRIARWQAG